MSFIHLSTVQPTDGQQDVTERDPAFIKNDFKNGIFLKKGETVELVSLRLAFNKIEIIESVNDTFYFQIGNAPNFTQLEGKITPGSYDEEGLAVALQNAFNSAINLPSFMVQNPLDSTNPTTISNTGVEVVYTGPTSPTDNGKYSISFNQMDNDAVGQSTASRFANAQNDSDEAIFCPFSTLHDTTCEGVFNGGDSNDTQDVWSVNTLLSFTPDYYNAGGGGATADGFFDTMEEAQSYNIGHDFINGVYGAQLCAQGWSATNLNPDGFSDNNQAFENPEYTVGLLDTEGRLQVGVSPTRGFTTAELVSVFGTTSTPAGPVEVMISELARNSRTGALNVSQAIVVPPQFQGHDVTTIELHLNNASGSVMNVVLDLYDSITDSTSTNVATRFAGLTPFATTIASQVPATGTTTFVPFVVDADTSIHNTFYIVLREENNGSMSGLSIQGSFGVDLGGTNGNMLAGLKHKVKGNSPGVSGSAPEDQEWTLTFDQDGNDCDGVVTVLGGASNNNWDFRYDIANGQTIPANDGTNRLITRIYGVFSPSTDYHGVRETGGLFWGVGGDPANSSDDGTGNNSLGTPLPADASDPDNWTFQNEFLGVAGSDLSTFYWVDNVNPSSTNFDIKGFYCSTRAKTSTGNNARDYWRISWDTEGIEDQDEDSFTPRFIRTDGNDATLTAATPPTPICYPQTRVGINRREREVSATYQELNGDDPWAPVYSRGGTGDDGFGGRSTSAHETTDWWIQTTRVKDGEALPKIDSATGCVVPVIQVCVLQDMTNKELYPSKDNIQSIVVFEEYVDEILGVTFDTTKDLLLQVRVDNMNKLEFGVGFKAQQDPTRAGRLCPLASTPAGASSAIAVYTTGGSSQDSQIKQSHYPLIGSVNVSRGNSYNVINSVNQNAVLDLCNYVWVDGVLSKPDFEGNGLDEDYNLNFQRQVREVYPKISFPTQPTINNKQYQVGNMLKAGRITASDVIPRLTNSEQDPTDALYYRNRKTDKVFTEYRDKFNLANIDRIFGFNPLGNKKNELVVGNGSVSWESENKLRTHPLTDVFNVELLSEPIKSHNGARGDIGKAIYTLSAEELEIDIADRVVTFQPKNRLPVELNLSHDKTVYSLTCAIKDVNNRLINGLRPPSDITLFKSLPEGTKIQRAIKDLKEVMTGKSNDKNANIIDNLGQNNPLLGVIPK